VDTAEIVRLDAERQENLRELLWESHRDAVPIRESFLQLRGAPPEPGPLAEIVRKGYHHAFDTYLVMLGVTSAPPFRLHVSVDFWAPLLRRPTQSLRNGRLALYRSLAILDDLDLFRQETHLGVPRFQLLNESGSGDPYFHPADRREHYLTLPHAYWERGIDRELGLPGKAVLLMARSLHPSGFNLPTARASEWYGISPDTVRRGIDELVRAKLLAYTKETVPSRNAPRGTTVRRSYVLVGPMTRRRPSKPRNAA